MHTVRRQLSLPEAGAPTGAGIRVAVLDTGIDLNHPDFAGRIDLHASASFTTKEDLIDRNGHGSHVAGIIGGNGAASNGVLRGIAPECELVILKISETSRALEWNSERALEYVLDELHVDIINYSNGHYPDQEKVGPPPWVWSAERNALEEYFEAADAAGILCVAAAGNAGPHPGTISRPGGLEAVLTVGAVDGAGSALQISSRGPFRRRTDLPRNAVRRFDGDLHNVQVLAKPSLVAPGEVTAPRAAHCRHGEQEPELADPDYVSIAGSSQATAVVSGIAALALQALRSRNVDLGPNPTRTLRRLLMRSTMQLGGDSTEIGEGLVAWPSLVATIEDFIQDAAFRNTLLSDELRLI